MVYIGESETVKVETATIYAGLRALTVPVNDLVQVPRTLVHHRPSTAYFFSFHVLFSPPNFFFSFLLFSFLLAHVPDFTRLPAPHGALSPTRTKDSIEGCAEGDVNDAPITELDRLSSRGYRAETPVN